MSKTIVDNRQINYNFFPSYIRCFHYTFSSQAQDQLPTQAKMIAILNNVFIKKKYNIIAQVKDYKVDAMIFCPGCSCKFNLRFIPYFLFLSSSCLFCSFQFAVRFSPPLLLVSCSRITKKHTCTNDELFILNLYVKEHDSKIANKYLVKCIPKLWWLHHQNPRQGVAFWGTRHLPALLLWSGPLPWFLTQQLCKK